MIDLDDVFRTTLIVVTAIAMYTAGHINGQRITENVTANREATALAELERCIEDRTVNTALLHAHARQTRDIVDAMGVR